MIYLLFENFVFFCVTRLAKSRKRRFECKHKYDFKIVE